MMKILVWEGQRNGGVGTKPAAGWVIDRAHVGLSIDWHLPREKRKDIWRQKKNQSVLHSSQAGCPLWSKLV